MSIPKTAVIGDVHGCLRTLKALIEKIPKEYEIVMCGDLIDRGPDSAGVVNFIRKNSIRTVLANHEDWMRGYLLGPGKYPILRDDEYSYWGNSYSDVTLGSYYPKERCRELAEEDAKWFSTLPLSIEIPNGGPKGTTLIITHTTVGNILQYCKKIDINDSTTRYYTTWGRDLGQEIVPGYFMVFGHTPQYGDPLIKGPEKDGSGWACIDTGAYVDHVGFSKLTAILMPEMKIISQPTDELDLKRVGSWFGDKK